MAGPGVGTASAPRLAPAPATGLTVGDGQASPSPIGTRLPAHVPTAVVRAHLVSLAAAFLFWAYLDRNLWFFGDEWDFLTRRGLHGAYFSIWSPHNEHWSVLPILLWRAIYSLEHLSSYWPYLLPLLLVHVAVVHLLWRRCLREGADPLVATALATLFAFLGAGAEDLVWAFQIGFLSSLLFGLLAMEVLDGPSLPWKGRSLPSPLVLSAPSEKTAPGEAGRASLLTDVTASALALAALMCSSVGVASCAALGTFLLGRSGWRRTVVVLAAPVCAYLTWFTFAGRSGFKATGDYMSFSVLLRVPVFVESNLANDLGHAAGWGRLGSSLTAAVLLWVVLSFRRLLTRHPAVLGGALGATVFYALAAVGRDRISATLTPSRYAYVGVAFLLPALALMLTGIRDLVARRTPGTEVRRAPWAYVRRAMVLPVILTLLAAATLGNVVLGVRFARNRTMYVRGLEDQIVTSAALLQDETQMKRADNTYPIWASGRASGYLTPQVLASLYRGRLLPKPHPSLMTATEILNDQTWLDVNAGPRRMFPGHFRLLSAVGVTWLRTTPNLLLEQRPDTHGLHDEPLIGLHLGGADVERALLLVDAYELRRSFVVGSARDGRSDDPVPRDGDVRAGGLDLGAAQFEHAFVVAGADDVRDGHIVQADDFGRARSVLRTGAVDGPLRAGLAGGLRATPRAKGYPAVAGLSEIGARRRVSDNPETSGELSASFGPRRAGWAYRRRRRARRRSVARRSGRVRLGQGRGSQLCSGVPSFVAFRSCAWGALSFTVGFFRAKRRHGGRAPGSRLGPRRTARWRRPPGAGDRCPGRRSHMVKRHSGR